MQKIWCVWFSRQLWCQPSACPCWRSETVETGNQQMATDISRTYSHMEVIQKIKKRFLIKGMRGIGKAPEISKWWASSWREKLMNNKSSTNHKAAWGCSFRRWCLTKSFGRRELPTQRRNTETTSSKWKACWIYERRNQNIKIGVAT